MELAPLPSEQRLLSLSVRDGINDLDPVAKANHGRLGDGNPAGIQGREGGSISRSTRMRYYLW